MPYSAPLSGLNVPLKTDLFLRTLLANLADTLESVVGLQDASGFIAVVGNLMGEEINEYYCQALETNKLSREQVTQVLIDLKHRIEGSFYLIEENDEKIVLGNSCCPLGEGVVGHFSLCMMTSSVFGVIVSQNLGYAKIVLDKTIAKGDGGCRIVVYLKPTDEANLAEGREYYQV